MAEFFPLQFPAIPGNDAAGVAHGLGQGVEGTSLGDRVFGTTMLEGSAEARRAVRVGADPAGRGVDGLLDTAGFGSLGTLFTIVGTPGRSRASPTSALRPSVLDSSTV